MNYIIIGGTGFIGTHLTILIKQQYPDAQVYLSLIHISEPTRPY